MDKRAEANKKVKNSISKALFKLMREKDISKISVTELVKEAKVARMSYYRNYSCIRDVIETYLSDMMDEFKATAPYEVDDIFSRANVLHSYRFFYKHRDTLELLLKCGYSGCWEDIVCMYNEEHGGSMPMSSIERYHLYFAYGSFCASYKKWMNSGFKESPEEMAECLSAFLHLDH